MARILVNAVNLRSGGGIQVVGGLLSRLDERNDYVVLWNEPDTRDRIAALAGERSNLTYDRPCSRSNAAAFLWLMTRFPAYVRRSGAALVLNVNHHFPTGRVPQVVYHMNVLRFARPRGPATTAGELAERLRDRRASLALTKADANVFESRYLADLAEERAGTARAGEVVYIGLDDRRPVPPPSEAHDAGTILAITSPAPHKDNATLVDMLAILCREQPDVPWKLVIAGGRGRQSFGDMADRAATSGITDRIEWLGYVDHARLAEIGARSLCLVTASRVESFCMVALEAMSWGCPAVVADATAMPESVADAGLLAPPGDAAAFARHVRSIAGDHDLRARLVARSRELAARRTWTQAARRFDEIFSNLLS